MCRGAPADVCMETCSTDNWPLRPLNRTLEYLGDLYEELYGGDDALFPFALAHTGGDEVKYDCWDEDNASSTFLADRNLTSKQAYLLMLNTNARIMRERGGRRPVAWDDAYYYYRDGVDASIALMFWSNVADLMQEAADAGHELVAAPSTPLYLSADDDWGCGDVYNYDPCDPSNPVDSDNTVNTTASCARVLGIEAAAWGEVMDASTLLATLFPRAAGRGGAGLEQPGPHFLHELLPRRQRVHGRAPRPLPLPPPRARRAVGAREHGLEVRLRRHRAGRRGELHVPITET